MPSSLHERSKNTHFLYDFLYLSVVAVDDVCTHCLPVLQYSIQRFNPMHRKDNPTTSCTYNVLYTTCPTKTVGSSHKEK